MFWICDPFGLGTFMRCKTSPQKGSENRFCEWVSKQNCQTPCVFFFSTPALCWAPQNVGQAASLCRVTTQLWALGEGGGKLHPPWTASLAFTLGLHLFCCVCLSCLDAGEAWGEPLPVDFWQWGGRGSAEHPCCCRAPCSAVVFHLSSLKSLTEEWAEPPSPQKWDWCLISFFSYSLLLLTPSFPISGIIIQLCVVSAASQTLLPLHSNSLPPKKSSS